MKRSFSQGGGGVEPRKKSKPALDALLVEAVRHGVFNSVRQLLRAGANANANASSEGSVLMLAVTGRRQDVCQLLISHGADVNFQSCNYSALLKAVAIGDRGIFDLLESHGARYNTRASNVWEIAAKHNQDEAFKWICQRAGVGQANDNGAAALKWAVRNANCFQIQSLLRQGVNVNTQEKNSNNGFEVGYTPLMWAARFGCHHVVSILLGHPDIDPNLQNKSGYNALMIAITQMSWSENHMTIVNLLIQAGVSLNQRDFVESKSPLGFAAVYNRMSVAKALIAAGAYVDVAPCNLSATTNQMLPIMWGVINEQFRLLQLKSVLMGQRPTGIQDDYQDVLQGGDIKAAFAKREISSMLNNQSLSNKEVDSGLRTYFKLLDQVSCFEYVTQSPRLSYGGRGCGDQEGEIIRIKGLRNHTLTFHQLANFLKNSDDRANLMASLRLRFYRDNRCFSRGELGGAFVLSTQHPNGKSYRGAFSDNDSIGGVSLFVTPSGSSVVRYAPMCFFLSLRYLALNDVNSFATVCIALTKNLVRVVPPHRHHTFLNRRRLFTASANPVQQTMAGNASQSSSAESPSARSGK